MATFVPGDQPTVVSESVVHAAWRDFGDPRTIVSVHEVSAMVSTNRVYRLTLDDDSRIIAKVSSYGSYFLFAEDHDRIHRCSTLLSGGDYEHLLADALTQDGERPYIWYDGEVWAIFYVEVEVRDRLPKVLTDRQVANLAEEMARFHKACTSIAPLVPLTSKSIKSDAIHLLDLVGDRSAADRFALDQTQLATVRRHTHDFLSNLESVRYDYWAKMPVLIDWNLGNFSVAPAADDGDRGRFRLYSRWDYDWFRIEPRHLDFYFLSRVSSRTGDRTRFTYGAHTLLEPRFRRFLGVYHRIFPLSEDEVLFLKDAYRFFLLNYVVREGQHFFRHDFWLHLQHEVVDVHLPKLDELDLRPLLDELGHGIIDVMVAPEDLHWGAFSEQAPWVVEPEAMAWRASVDDLRARAAREAPALASTRGWPPAARVLTVTARLLAALGPWWHRKRRGRLTAGSTESRTELSRRLRVAAEALGPTYIKLGQIISSGEGLFPEELVGEFKLCRDQVRAEPFSAVRRVVEEDLGATLEATFAWFDRTPLAAASIAQVHAARLRSGEDVVVKVQRPAVATLVRKDLRVMAWLAPALVGRIPIAALANPPALVELFAETIVEELDFRLEAANQLDIARVLADLGQRGYVVPRPHPTLVTRRVLVMERLSGFKFDDVAGMKAAGVDTEAVIRTGMVAFMEGAMIHGVFHGDLHGGNLFVLPDGRTALLDFGIVGRLTDERRRAFLRLMLGATTSDVRGQLAALRDLGALPRDTDLREVIRDLRLDQAPVDPTTLSGEELVHEVQRLVKALLGYGARMPKELMLYVKNMVFLDGAIARLAPDLDIIAEIGAISMHFAQRHGERLGQELGIDPSDVEINLDSVKAGFGLDASAEGLTYRELQQRRELINKRMREHVRR